jgi:MGT family glycosyltransferase
MSVKGIFFNIPGYGHVNPTLPMVKELIARGEQIDYCCTEEFRPSIEHAGATFIPFPDDLLHVTNDNVNLLAIFADLIEKCYEILPQVEAIITKGQYDYMLVDMYTPWGRLLAEKLKLPLVTFFPSFALHNKMKEPPDSKLQLVKSLGVSLKSGVRLYKFYKKIQKKYGVPSVDILSFLSAEVSELCITFTAKEFQPQPELFPSNYLFTGPNIDLKARISDPNFSIENPENKKLVYMSLGSMVVRREFIKTCIAAFRASDYLVILNISKYLDASDFEVPSNITLCNFAPQLEILSKADLFITHGGMNSAHEGIYFEVPLIVLPQFGDQFLVAQQVVNQKLGIWLDHKKLSSGKLLKSVTETMENKEMKSRLTTMSTALKAAGGFEKAADEVQAFIQKKVACEN